MLDVLNVSRYDIDQAFDILHLIINYLIEIQIYTYGLCLIKIVVYYMFSDIINVLEIICD